MNRDESIALLRQGKEAWNAWAREMLARRKELEQKLSGKYPELKKDGVFTQEEPTWLLQPNSKLKDLDEDGWQRASAWVKESTAYFAGVLFHDGSRMSERNIRDFFAERKKVGISAKDNPNDYHVGEMEDYANYDTDNDVVEIINPNFEGFIFPGMVFFSYPAIVEGTRYKKLLPDLFEPDYVNDPPAIFACTANFAGTEFREPVFFINCKFLMSDNPAICYLATSHPITVDFTNAKFRNDIYFYLCDFRGQFSFVAAEFFEYFYFRKNVVRQYSEFDFSTFYRGTHVAEGDVQIRFDKTVFDGDIIFTGTVFNTDISFDLCEFNMPAKFSESFEENWYMKYVNVIKINSSRASCVTGNITFRKILSKRGLEFDHVKFDIPPDFTDADFHEPLVLDADRIDETASLALERAEWLKLRLDERYRLLRQYAERRKDRKNELEFRARELRAWRHRFMNDRKNTYYPGAWGVYFISLLYEILSNYGRSFQRPAVGWLASVILYALVYYLASGAQALKEAILLSLRQGFVVSGFTKTEYYDSLLHKVFMPHEKGQNTLLDLGWGYLLLMSQTAMSLLFLFLLALAIRNHLRMR